MEALCYGLPEARWRPPESLHLTLRFFGDLPESWLPEIDSALGRIRAAGFPVAPADLDIFGPAHARRLLVVRAQGDPALLDLAARIEKTTVAAGLSPQHRKFAPHVTLARLERQGGKRSRCGKGRNEDHGGRGGTDRLADYLARNNLITAPPWLADEFILFRSHLKKTGPIYEDLRRYPLRPVVKANHDGAAAAARRP